MHGYCCGRVNRKHISTFKQTMVGWMRLEEAEMHATVPSGPVTRQIRNSSPPLRRLVPATLTSTFKHWTDQVYSTWALCFLLSHSQVSFYDLKLPSWRWLATPGTWLLQPNDKVCYWFNIKNKVSVVFKQTINKCTFHRYCLTVVYFIKKTRVQIWN